MSGRTLAPLAYLRTIALSIFSSPPLSMYLPPTWHRARGVGTSQEAYVFLNWLKSNAIPMDSSPRFLGTPSYAVALQWIILDLDTRPSVGYLQSTGVRLLAS